MVLLLFLLWLLWVSPAVEFAQEAPKAKRIAIAVTEKGFTPSSITVESGVPLELVFTRRTDKTCATEVVVPARKIRRALPLDEPVAIAVTPEKDEIAFACGMNMFKGKLVVREGGPGATK